MNWKVMRTTLTLHLLLIIASNGFAAGVLPVGRTEYKFIYDRMERVDALSTDYFTYQLGPYSFEKAEFTLGPFENLKRIQRKSVQLFSFINEDFRAAKEAMGRGFESFRGGLAAAPSEKLFAYANFVLDERKAQDATYYGKKWRGLAGDVEQAFVYYRSGPLALTVGRFASFWGPRSSLLLSPRVAMDGFGYTFRWGRLALSYRLARLDGLDPDRDSVAQFENRYFAGHRLDILLSKRLQVGLFETVIFGGPGRQIDLFYLNPIIFYHGAQLNEGMDDNTFLGFDFSVKPKAGVKLYGQLLVDDFQIDRKTQGDQEPDEMAFLAGAYLANLLPTLDLKAEYSRVTNWTFNQAHESNRYLFKNQLIGGALGNDYDLTEVSLIKWFEKDLATSLNFAYARQGEGCTTDEWTAPWLLATGDYSEPFPTGVVQKTTSAVFNIKGFFKDHFYFDVDVGVDWVSNFNHRSGDKRSIPFLNLRISSFFSTPVSVE